MMILNGSTVHIYPGTHHHVEKPKSFRIAHCLDSIETVQTELKLKPSGQNKNRIHRIPDAQNVMMVVVVLLMMVIFVFVVIGRL